MAVGPIQVIVFGFETTEKMRGEALRELANLRGRGLIRVVDLSAVKKDASGAVTRFEHSDLTPTEQAEFGAFIGLLIGAGAAREAGGAPLTSGSALEAVEKTIGLNLADLNGVIDTLQPGQAAAILVVEHTWAIGLRDAVRNAGGVPLAQGFLSPEALIMVGRELEAMAEAEQAIEVSQVIKGAAMLDALMAVEQAVEVVEAAEQVKTAVAADVLRTLIVADLIEEAAMQEAVDALVTAGLIEAAAAEEAAKAVEASQSEAKALLDSAKEPAPGT